MHPKPGIPLKSLSRIEEIGTVKVRVSLKGILKTSYCVISLKRGARRCTVDCTAGGVKSTTHEAA